MPQNAARLVRPEELKTLKVGETITDSVPGRGKGAVLFERKSSGTIAASYRYSLDGKRKKISIGRYRERPKEAGLTLSEIRERAIDLARLAAEHGDIAKHQAELERIAQIKRIEAEQIAALEAAKGTLEDLLLDYIQDRTGKLDERTVSEMQRVTANLKAQNPEILALHAALIRPQHIKELLLPTHQRGSKVMAERIRRQIAAAFNYGMKAENVVGRSSDKSYAIETNPAAIVAVEHTENKGTRALSEAELRQFWLTLEKTDRVGPILARLFKFVLATAGQRFASVIDAEWSAYDLEQGVVHLFHNKGRGGKAQRRAHPIPLSPRALEILAEVHTLNGGRARPWTNRSDGRPVALSSLKNVVNRWLASDHAKINGEPIQPFTARDLRRTCAQLMAQYGIDDRLSDELQAHGVGGVVADHYRNNPIVTLPRRRGAMADFDQILDRILS